MPDRSSEIESLLPGFNCGECGHQSCAGFAVFLSSRLAACSSPRSDLNLCPYISQQRFADASLKIIELMMKNGSAQRILGVIDGLEAEITISPLHGEPSCREDLFAFDRSISFNEGDFIRYRPLGCPVTHFGRVLCYEHGILTVHLTGPIHLLGKKAEYKDLGVCMVAAFEGLVSQGRMPHVGQTIRFIPHQCMMQKVHSGVVVHAEGRMIRIEGIDLKVW
jgi:uncharacterized Fe-S cluster-containing protein